MPQTCRRCPATIYGVITSKGKWMPVDVAPHERGNIRLDHDQKEAEVLGRAAAEAARASGERLYISHFASCPEAASFRKR